MCASYGLGGFGPHEVAGHYGLDSRDDRRVDERGLGDWLETGRARITGRIARNLNPIVREDDDGRLVEPAWWWLWLDGSGPASFSAFNARDDALLHRWRPHFRARRALVPATSFVEKKHDFHAGGALFSLAAIYHVVETADGPLTTYSLVTQDTPEHLAGINPRMPLVVAPEAEDEWLDRGRDGDAALLERTLAASADLAAALTVDDDRLF